MGVLTDLVIADVGDAEAIGRGEGDHLEKYDGIDAKGMDQVKMGKLHAILGNTEYDSDYMINEKSFLFTASDEGPWVQLVPGGTVKLLSDLRDHDIERIGKLWFATDEFQGEFGGWEYSIVETFLRELVALSRKAVAQGKAVLMWTCL